MSYRTTALTVLTVVAGLATATAAAEARPTKLGVSSGRVQAGDALRITGTGWPGRRGVSLFVTRRGDERERVAVVRADRRGRFSKRVRIDADALAGRYAVTACTNRCRRARTVRLTVTPPAPVAPPPVASAPPVASGQAPAVVSVPADGQSAIAELERRMKGTRWFDSEQLGNCSFGCSLSETTLRFCSDASWTEDSQSVNSLNGSTSRGHEEGSWRVLSATTANDGSVQGDVRFSFGPNSDAVTSGSAAPGAEDTGRVAFGPAGSGRASLGGREYAVGPADTCS